jgi:uncharacterized protein (DUF433 family)
VRCTNLCYLTSVTNPLLSRITSDPAIFGGKPIIRGHRFAVEHLLGYLNAGTSEAELLSEFPFLEPDDIKAAKLFVAREGL